MGKPNQFKRTLNARERVANAKSLAEAARTIGVNRSTVFRWIQQGKVPAPGTRVRVKREVTTRGHLPDNKGPFVPTSDVETSLHLPDPKHWAAAVRAKYDLSATENTLVDLGVAALAIAEDKEQRPEVRLAAMGRYAALVKQLNLESEMEDGAVETVGRWPRRVS